MVTLLEEIDPAYYKYFIYILSPQNFHACRIQEGYIRQYKGITILLGETLKNLEEMG